MNNNLNKFKIKEKYSPTSVYEKHLAKAFSILKNEKESASFLRDLMTPQEIEEFSKRLEIARLLLEKFSYKEIAEKLGTSTTTVTRVAQWLFNGCGGYVNVLKSLYPKYFK